MPESLRWFAIAAGVLAAAMASAEPQEFSVTPELSHVEIAAGSKVTVHFGAGVYGLGSVLIPLTAPSSGSGFAIPGSTPGDGLHTALEGTLFIEVSEARDSIRFVGRRTNIEMVDSGNWLPGPPGDAATPTVADLAVQFDDAPLTITGNLAVRDAVLSIDSGGQSLPLVGAGDNTWTFQAGCGPDPCLRITIEAATVDGETTLGPIGRIGVPMREEPANPGGAEGSLEELPDGSLRVRLPISITTSVLAAELGSPIPTDLTVVLTGEIVAVPVPEPGRAALALAAVGALAVLVRRRQRQPRKRRRRVGLATAALVALMTGSLVSCWGPPQIGYGRMSLIGGFSCFAERIKVTKPGNTILDYSYPTCLSQNFNGFFGHSPEVAFTMDPFSAFLYQAGHHALVTLAVTTGFNLTSAIPMTINHTMSFDHWYSAVEGGSFLRAGDPPPQLFARAQMYRLGSAQDEELLPSVSVTIGGAAQARLANGGSLDVPVDGAYHFFDLDAGGGSIQFDLEFEGQRIAAGSGTQMLGVSFGVRADTCMAHQECVDINPEAPFCSPVGCTDGATGTACSHDSQCQEAQGLFCSSLGTCSNGTVGAACIEGEGDCDPGLACSSMLCAAP